MRGAKCIKKKFFFFSYAMKKQLKEICATNVHSFCLGFSYNVQQKQIVDVLLIIKQPNSINLFLIFFEHSISVCINTNGQRKTIFAPCKLDNKQKQKKQKQQLPFFVIHLCFLSKAYENVTSFVIIFYNILN